MHPHSKCSVKSHRDIRGKNKEHPKNEYSHQNEDSPQKEDNSIIDDDFKINKIIPKNDRNSGIWQSGILKSLAEYVQRPVCFINVQSSLHENVVFFACALMDNAAYIIFIMWNSISGLEPWYHFRFNISCGVAVTVRSHQKNFR